MKAGGSSVRRTHSLKRQLIFLLTGVLALLIALLLFSNFYGAMDSNRKIAASNERTLEYSANQIEKELDNVDEIMLGLTAADNTAFRALSEGAAPLRAHTASQELLERLKEYLRVYTFCDAFFVYSTPSDSYRDIFGDNIPYNDKENIRSWMKEAVSENAASYSDGWFTREIEGESYLMRFYGGKGTYLIALCSFDTLKENIGLYSAGEAQIVFCTDDGTDISAVYPDIDFQKALSSPEFTLDGRPRRMILHKNISNTDVVLLLLIGDSEFFSELSDMQLFLIGLSLLSILLIPFSLYWVHQSVLKPLDLLEKTMADIRAGDLEAEVESSGISEFEEVGRTFNGMMKQIRRLKIETYEKEIAAQKAQLQYLQLQIRPHFYLNCLKSLYAVAQQKDIDKVQRIILSISGHLRYIFHDQLELVTLREEINHIKSYVDMQRMFLADPPDCCISVPEELEEVMIPPLSLSTFVENSFKHRVNEKLTVIVKAMELDNGTERFLDLTVQDDGGGFSEQVLKELSEDDTFETVYSSEHIGIRNIRQRFRLIYGKKVLFAFYNTPRGAVSEIMIPMDNKDNTDDETKGGKNVDGTDCG